MTTSVVLGMRGSLGAMIPPVAAGVLPPGPLCLQHVPRADDDEIVLLRDVADKLLNCQRPHDRRKLALRFLVVCRLRARSAHRGASLRCSASTRTTTRCLSTRRSRRIAKQIKSSSHAAGLIAKMIRRMSNRRTVQSCAGWWAIGGLSRRPPMHEVFVEDGLVGRFHGSNHMPSRAVGGGYRRGITLKKF